MAYEIEETDELTRKATFNVPRDEFESEINNRLNELSEQVELDGFRKGKVPMSVMHQRYGQQVTREVVEELINDSINDLIEQLDNVLYLGTPTVEQVPGPQGDELVFSVELELRPDVDPIGYLGLEVEQPEVQVSGEDVDQQIEALRHEHADTKPVALREEIASGDIVTLDFEALDDREELEPMQGEDVEIEVGAGQALPGIDEALEGADLDATVESEVELGERFPAEDLRGEKVPVRLDVKKVEQRVLPQLDDDFALQTGAGETLLELRGNIRERIEEQRRGQARQMAREQLVDQLLEQNDFELPPNFVDQQLENTAERRVEMLQQQGIDPDELDLDLDALKEQMRDEVVRQIKTEFLLMEIARKEQIEVNEEDMREFFEQQAQQAGVNPQQYMALMRQNEEMFRQANATVLLDKTKDHLLDEAEVAEIDWEKFQEKHGQAGPGAAAPGELEEAQETEETEAAGEVEETEEAEEVEETEETDEEEE